MFFLLSFVVYFHLRLQTLSCNIPLSDGYSEEGICVLCLDRL